MNTHCKNCSFAIYEGKTQTGCEFDRLNKLPKSAKLVEAYDDESEFFVIENFMCNTARPKNKWAHADKENRKELVLKEIEIDYEVIITDPELAVEATDNLSKQALQPDYVTILIDNDKTKAGEILADLRKRALPFKWKVTNCLEGIDPEIRHHNVVSDSQFMCLVYGKGLLPQFDKINDYINLDLGRFALAEDDTCMVINMSIYRTLGSISNIKELAKKTNEEELIKTCNQWWA